MSASPPVRRAARGTSWSSAEETSDLTHQQDCVLYDTIANTQDLVTFEVAFVEKDEMGLTMSTARDEESLPMSL